MSLNPLISTTPPLAMVAAEADPVAAAAAVDDARFRAKAQAAQYETALRDSESIMATATYRRLAKVGQVRG